MGKQKAFIKEETIKRLNTLLRKYDRDDLLESREYQSLLTYMNWYEKENAEEIIQLASENKSYDEIRFIVDGGTSIMKNSRRNRERMNKKPTIENQNKQVTEAEELDPVEEAVFMISQQKVVETDKPVDVIILGDESFEIKDEEDNKSHNEASNTEVDDEMEEKNDPIILSDITKNKKKDKHKDEKLSSTGNPILDAINNWTSSIDRAIAKAEKYCKDLEKEDAEIEKEIRDRYKEEKSA